MPSSLLLVQLQPPTAGAYGEPKEIDSNATDAWAKVATFDGYATSGIVNWVNPTLESYTSQVVAGTNYKIVVSHSAGKHVVTIFTPLPHTQTSPSISNVEAC
jgi:hypothetical protein